MSTITLLMLAVGVSMDAFAVSLSNGISYRIQLAGAVRVGVAFGLAQGLMPVIGYFAGQMFSGPIQALDHWIALILLGYIGGKMIWEAVKELRGGEEEEGGHHSAVLDGKTLLMQAIATSIDALAVGISFAAMRVNIVVSALMIGVTTCAFCVCGCLIGKKFGALLKEKAEIFGGCVLVFIGLKIFIEHTFGL